MKSIFSNPPLSENAKVDEKFSASVGNAAFSSSHGTAAIDEAAQIGYVVADAQKEVEFAAKDNRSVTAELAKAYKRFPELLSENGNESGSYDDEKPGNGISHNVNPVESGPVKPCQQIPHAEEGNQ